MKESNLAKIFLPKWQMLNGKDSYLCRNNTGAYEKNGNWIVYGIGLLKKIKRAWRVRGGGDYIGWTSKTICDIVPKVLVPSIKQCCDKKCEECKVAIFTSIELKTKGVKATKEQIEWMDKVNSSGGIGEIVKEGEF